MVLARLLPRVSILILISIFILPIFSRGETTYLPRTGQTKIYQTGDDGYWRKGVGWFPPRFKDNGDGTMTDTLTGLMWLKDANYAKTIGHDPDGTGDGRMTWEHALDFVKTINVGGYTDRRLPNINELMSLVNYGLEDQSPWLRYHGFRNIEADFAHPSRYWSSSHGYYKDHAYTIRWYDAYIYPERKSWVGAKFFVWLVRGNPESPPAKVWQPGQEKYYDTDESWISCEGTGQDGEIRAGADWPVPRFTDHGDGTVTDNLTGLMWTKDARITITQGLGHLSWKDAINFCNNLELGGYTDWRLPNVNEMRSLIDFSRLSGSQ